MDPLSDVISLLKPHSYTCSGFDVGGDHSVQFPRYEGIKYYALVSGQLWLLVEGRPEALRLDAGDCVLLTGGQPCCLTTDPSLPASDVGVFKSMIRHNGDIVILNGGGDSLTLGGHFLLSGLHANVLLDLLPPVLCQAKFPEFANRFPGKGHGEIPGFCHRVFPRGMQGWQPWPPSRSRHRTASTSSSLRHGRYDIRQKISSAVLFSSL